MNQSDQTRSLCTFIWILTLLVREREGVERGGGRERERERMGWVGWGGVVAVGRFRKETDMSVGYTYTKKHNEYPLKKNLKNQIFMKTRHYHCPVGLRPLKCQKIVLLVRTVK